MPERHGQHMEHNFGHGHGDLASALPVCNLLAFSIQAACKWQNKAWREARQKWVTGRDFFGALRGFLCTILFGSWDEFLEFMNATEGIRPNGQGSPPS